MSRQVHGRELPLRVEATRTGCYHACTVDDVATLLNFLPARHVSGHQGVDGIQGIVLRQPTRKQQTLSPAWARLGYSVDVGGVFGPVVFLEAQEIPLTFSWGTSLGPEDVRELDRLQRAADHAERSRRGHKLHFGLEGVRRVQLFHSLPHEIGHWADMLEHVELPGLDDLERWERLWNRCFQRPASEREAFAHIYAESVIDGLRKSGSVPFDRKLDVESLPAEGLRLGDFGLKESGPGRLR